ncbi:hypothetical protein ACFL96_07900 [Thermoproteota archaeon]
MVVYIIENACPLCGADVKGNEKYSYYCSKCNVLFKMSHLSKKQKKEIPKEEEADVKKELELAKEGIKVETKPEDIPAKTYNEETEPLEEPEPVEEEPEEIKIVASVKSNKMHISTCHFLKKIHKDNWIHLDSLDEGVKKGFIPCVCIRRKGLMKI